MAEQTEVDQKALENLVKQVMGGFAGAMSALLVRVGEQTGLFKALAKGAATSVELAVRAGLAERYVREWLAAMAAAAYVDYDPESRQFSLSPEQVQLFANDASPYYLPPYTDFLKGVYNDEAILTAAFRSGEGIPWGAHHQCVFCGTERITRQIIPGQLIERWLPQLKGGQEKLSNGVKVADIGCGRGATTIAIAQAFPNSSFYGFDIHEPSIEYAKEQAREKGVTNVHFTSGTAKDFIGDNFDVAIIIDALHDMGDPVGVAGHVRQTLKPGGAFLIVEPFAEDILENNFNLRGQFAFAASTCVCTPASLSQEVGLALGAQAGRAKLTSVLEEAGFNMIETIQNEPVHIVLEARA